MEYIEKQKESQELRNKFHDLLDQSFSMLQQYLNKNNLYGVELIITNNGKKLKNIIVEHQGIKGMRRKVIKINGNLYITTVPNFKSDVKIG